MTVHLNMHPTMFLAGLVAPRHGYVMQAVTDMAERHMHALDTSDYHCLITWLAHPHSLPPKSPAKIVVTWPNI